MDVVEPVIDVPALMDRMAGDRDLLQELVALYTADEGTLLGQIDAAIAAGDADALRRAAHTLKGAVSNFCAPHAQSAALALEMAGRAGSLGETAVMARRLREELGRFRIALNDLVA